MGIDVPVQLSRFSFCTTTADTLCKR